MARANKNAAYRKAVESLKDPENIKEALYASGPNGLMRAFDRDPTVQRLLKGGNAVAGLVAEQVKQHGRSLDDITLCCYVYILQKLDVQVAAETVKPLFPGAVERPDPFFVNFATHTLRDALRLPIDPLDPLYSRGEVLETLERM